MAWELDTLDLALLGGAPFSILLADPPWRFQNRTGKVVPEHGRLSRYRTVALEDICALPVAGLLAEQAHCYLWVPNALLEDGLAVLSAWGFTHKTMLVWHKVRADGGSDGGGVGFYFRNVSEVILFGVRGCQRALAPRSPAGERAGQQQAGALPQARRAP